MIARVMLQRSCARRCRTGPPVQPVFTSQAFGAVLSLMRFASSSAYLAGCHTMKAAPKQAEKVASGSVTPTSVPATLAV